MTIEFASWTYMVPLLAVVLALLLVGVLSLEPKGPFLSDWEDE